MANMTFNRNKYFTRMLETPILFEFYVNDIGEDDYNKARRYLANLEVDKK